MMPVVGACICCDREVSEKLRKSVGDAAQYLATFPQSSSLVSQGAESADIGKLDTAPEKAMKAIYELREELLDYSPSGVESGVEMGKVNRVDEPAVCKICGKKKMEPFPASGMFIMMANHYYCIGACEGSAETGGEKAAPHQVISEICMREHDSRRKVCFAEGCECECHAASRRENEI